MPATWPTGSQQHPHCLLYYTHTHTYTHTYTHTNTHACNVANKVPAAYALPAILHTHTHTHTHTNTHACNVGNKKPAAYASPAKLNTLTLGLGLDNEATWDVL
jgi:hypothetical protein